MNASNRREFLRTTTGLMFAGAGTALAAPGNAGTAGAAGAPGAYPANAVGPTSEPVPHADRLRGLLLGSLIGDAFGGPVEFQEPVKVAALERPPKVWRDGEVLDAAALREASSRVWLRGYQELRPKPEPYAHWLYDAAPGTITDDSRHKFILFHALRHTLARPERRLGVREYAQAHLDWPRHAVARNPECAQLCTDWIEEWRRGARWVLGSRDLAEARPPTRMWNSVPTCSGQMALPPLAGVFAGRPDAAYRAAYQIAFFDNGFGRDMNAALVAALATALTLPDVVTPPTDDSARRDLWLPVLRSLTEIDPYEHAKVPWMQRPVARWLDFALKAVDRADGHPARFFAEFEKEFQHTTKWEAQVPFAMVFGVLALARYEPLPALALSLEWGHDTDSYAQLLGAFLGARLGAGIFPQELRDLVTRRLRKDTGEDVEEWVRVLGAAAGRARDGTLMAME